MGEPTHDSSGDEKVPRAPRLTDISRLCAELNRLGARYVVVGGLCAPDDRLGSAGGHLGGERSKSF